MNDPVTQSSIRLNEAQITVLEWIKAGCIPGVFPEDRYTHRITARALENRGLVEISGHGASWRVTLTERGRFWPEATVEDEHERRRSVPQRIVAKQGGARAQEEALRRALRRMPRGDRSSTKIPTKHVQKQETYMRYKVVVTRVQTAERWIRATDEEDAARKVQDEFDKAYSYFGQWETRASEVQIVEAEQTTVVHPNPLSESGPMMLTLKSAAGALGIPYSALYELTNRGDIEYTRIGSRKYISRESLLEFIKENSHRGYSPQ